MRPRLVVAGLALGLVASAAAFAHGPLRGDPARGRGLASSEACLGCHGPAANGAVPQWPKLFGLNDRYLYRQLVHFRDGTRHHPFMTPQVQDLGNRDLRDLSAYFASRAPQSNRISGSFAATSDLEALRARGREVFREGLPDRGLVACTACHGPSGQGVDLVAIPSIRGQNAPYLAGELRAFRSGERTTDPGGVMREVARQLSDRDIRALSAFLATFGPAR